MIAVNAALTLLCFILLNTFFSLQEPFEDTKYESSNNYQQNLNLEGKGLCARALYDYQAGTCHVDCLLSLTNFRPLHILARAVASPVRKGI